VLIELAEVTLQLWAHLRTLGIDIERIQASIWSVITLTLLSAAADIPRCPAAFELFGIGPWQNRLFLQCALRATQLLVCFSKYTPLHFGLGMTVLL
jgi:hypothetical protein